MRLWYSLREWVEEVRGDANEIAGVEDKFPLIQKPFNISEIEEKVRALLQGSGSRQKS